MNCIRINRITNKLEVSRATIYRWLVIDSTFPKCFRFGAGNAVAWDEAEVDAWLESKKEARSCNSAGLEAA